MGRAKLPLKKIENTINRQVTYSKRKYGLIKKAYELSVLCDIEIALITFSPSGRLSHFSTKTSIEDVLSRFVDLPDEERGRYLLNKEALLSLLSQLKADTDVAMQQATPATTNPEVEELRRKITMLQQQLQKVEEQIRSSKKYEPDNHLKNKTKEELDQCEDQLFDTLKRVIERKNYLSGNHQEDAPNDQCDSSAQPQVPMYPFQDEEVGWIPQNNPSPDQSQIVPSIDFSSTIDHQCLVQGMKSNMSDLQNAVEPHVPGLSQGSDSALPLQEYTAFSTPDMGTLSPFINLQVQVASGDGILSSTDQTNLKMGAASSLMRQNDRTSSDYDAGEDHNNV